MGRIRLSEGKRAYLFDRLSSVGFISRFVARTGEFRIHRSETDTLRLRKFGARWSNIFSILEDIALGLEHCLRTF